MNSRRKTVPSLLCLMLALLLLAAPLAAGAAGLVLDRDAQGGYVGDYVLILNPHFPDGRRLSTGFLNGLIDTEVPAFELLGGAGPKEENAPLPLPDPYATSLQMMDII